jgi:hypothetical protein
MDELLNHPQKTSLRISLQMFEETLRHAQAWLDGHEEDAILYRRKLTLSEANKKQVLDEIEAALSLIEKVTREFGLKAESESVAAILPDIQNLAGMALRLSAILGKSQQEKP